MANTIFQLRRSSVAGKQPNTTTLSIGELGINLTDQKLYSSNGTVIFEVGANLVNQTVSNTLTVTTVSANGSLGTSGQVLTTNGSNVYWSTVSGGGGGANTTGTLPVRQQYTGNGAQTVFTVTGGYVANNLSVFLNGVLLRNGPEVNVSSGSTFTLSTAAPNNALIDVIGVASSYANGMTTIVSQQITANGSVSSYNITGGYIPNALTVYVNGVKQIPNTDVYVYNGTSIDFAAPVPNTYVIDIFGYQSTYVMPRSVNFTFIDNKFTGNGSVNTYTLTTTTNTNNAIVAINGVEQLPSTAYNITGNQLVFTSNVPNNSIVDVRIPYFTTTASGITASYANYTFTASNNQTTFTGSDDFGRLLTYLPSEAIIFQNGVKLVPTVDYTANTGNTVILVTGAANNDIIEVISLAGMIAADGDTFSDNVVLKSNTAAISANNLTTTSLSQQNVDSFSIFNYRSATYFAQVSANNQYHIQNINLVHNGSSVWLSEYGAVYSNGSPLATFDATINSNNVILQVTPVVSSSTVKVVRTAVTV
jgi:hypothetical protein